MSSETQSLDENHEVLKPHTFTASPTEIHAKETPYGKLLKSLQEMNNEMFEEAKYKEPYLELDDEKNVDGLYALALKKARDDARQGNYEGLMRHSLNLVNISPAEQENMVFDEMPTPAESEKIFLAMGAKQYPELAKAGFNEVQELWQQTGMGDIPDEFKAPNNRDMKIALPALRQNLYTMMLWSSNLLHPQAGEVGVKLCYAMFMLEKRLSTSMEQVNHPDMTMWERLAADDERKKLSQ